MRRVTDLSPHRWLTATGDDPSSLAGFDPRGWPDSTWILHAAYETDELPSGLTHDDVNRIERAAGTVPSSGSDVIDELRDGGKLIGNDLGPSEAPGDGWRRVSWLELGRRSGSDPIACEELPCNASFNWWTWPVNITPPAEGALDREQHEALFRLIADESRDGLDTECLVFFAVLPTSDFDEAHFYEATLREVIDSYGAGPNGAAPSNVWSPDRRWFSSSDWDLWATRFSGDQELVAKVEACADLETARLRV